MPEESFQPTGRERVLVRLDTFIRLRWYAIIGQAGAILLVAFYLNYHVENFSLPRLEVGHRQSRRLSSRERVPPGD